MNIAEIIKLPPVLFVLISIFTLIMFFLFNKLACKSSENPEGKFKSYACGEEPMEERRKPNYSQFFPLAFFFTIMHVVVLFVSILPMHIKTSLFIVFLFLIISFISITILFREEK